MSGKINAKPGHLAAGGPLHLAQTDKTRQALSRATSKQHSLSRMPVVKLDWKLPDKKESS